MCRNDEEHCGIHTVEVCGSHEGDVNTEVAMVRGAVQTQVDAKGN